MAAIEDADSLEDFNPDFPPDFGLGADDSLAAVFDDWDSKPRGSAPALLVNLLTELLSLLEAWRAEGATSNERLESRVVGELKEVQGDLVSIRTSENEAHQSYRQALRSLWQQIQELSTGVQGLATGLNYRDDSPQIAGELTLLRDRIAEVSITLQEQEQTVAGRLKALETKIQDAESRTEHLMNQADGIRQRLNEGLDLLEARGTAALESQKALQDRIARALEVFEERISGRIEQSNEQIVALQAGLHMVETSVAEDRDGTEASLAKGLDAMARNQQGLETRLTEGLSKALAEAQQATQAKFLAGFEAIAQGQQATATQLAKGLEALAQTQHATETKLGKAFEAIAQGQQNAEAGLAEGLEAVSAGQQGLQANLENLVRKYSEEAARGSEQTTKDLKEGFASLEPSHEETRAALSTLSQSVERTHKELLESGDRHLSSLLERLKTLEAAVGKSLVTGSEEREQLKKAVAILSDALKQFREEVGEDAGQSETRIRRQLESGEARTLGAISEISNSLLREQRAAKLDLETKIDRGVREPLKATVTLLNRQLNEIESTVGRTFEALRNADLTIRIDNMDALIESRLRSRKADGVVVLPSGAEAPSVSNEGEK